VGDRAGRSALAPGIARRGRTARGGSGSRTVARPRGIRAAADAALRRLAGAAPGGVPRALEDSSSSIPKTSASAVSAIRLRAPPPCAARVAPLLAALPPVWPVAAQAFRIPVEIVLWRLAVAGAIPELLSFHGRNVDILVGLTAPVVAYACFVRRAWPVGVARWWNWAGIVILLNVVVHAQLSAPTPWRIFETDPPATFIADWPYIWLPGFLVPLAWLLHAVSLRQLRAQR